MRRGLLFALCACVVLICASRAGAQGFRAVFASNSQDVWAVGDAGTIHRTVNGGTSWLISTLGNETLRDVNAVGFTAIVASDSGKIWRSVDSGGGWALTVVSGAPDLMAVAMPSADVAYVAGASGTILKSVDGGAIWAPQSSGTSVTLRALRFSDDLSGWAVGDNATVLRTVNGGTTWTPVSIGASRDLLDVDLLFSTVWIVGADASAFKSVNDGADWAPVDLKFDDLADVRVVKLTSASTVYLAGGGGFMRRSADGGATWSFMVTQLHAPITDVAFSGIYGFTVNADNRMVTTSYSSGFNWDLPTGATLTKSWVQKLGSGVPPGTLFGVVRGGTLQNHPTNKHAFYCAVGHQVFASFDDGDNWSVVATMPFGTGAYVNAFLISPKDTLKWLAAVDSLGVDRIVRTTDGGVSWSIILTEVGLEPLHFGTYGIPLEMHPDKPDTVLFGGESLDPVGTRTSLLRSTDFGATWAPLSTTQFRSPCDIAITPGNGNVVNLGDGITSLGQGELWRSTDGGVNFTKVYSLPDPSGPTLPPSESPGMATSRLRNTDVFATGWGGPGGLYRSTNSGASWAPAYDATACWGVDVCKEDPNVVVFGRYSGALSYLSLDGGVSFGSVTLSGANYTFYARDRNTMLAEQSSGVYKMNFAYSYTPAPGTQSVDVTSPNGGEIWAGGTAHDIVWTSTNVAATRIEYRRAPGEAWQTIADVPGTQTTYAWTVPMEATTTAKVRVRDLWDGAPTDSSDAVFTINFSPTLELIQPDGGEVWQYGTHHNITWNSPGVSFVDLELQVAGGPWDPIALSVPADGSAYDWTIPDVATTAARVRVTQTGGGLIDESAAPFTITVPRLAVDHDPYYLGGTLPGGMLSGVLTVTNPGTASLVISSATLDHPSFWLGRSSLTVPIGGNDTLGVFYTSPSEGVDTARVTLGGNDPTSPRVVRVIAHNLTNLAAGDPRPASFALWQNQPNPFTGATTVRYALPVEAPVSLEVFDVQGHKVATLAHGVQGAGTYTVAFGRGMAGADGRRAAALQAGVYFLRLRAGAFAAYRKMLLMH